MYQLQTGLLRRAARLSTVQRIFACSARGAATASATPGKIKVQVRDGAGHAQTSTYACGQTLMEAIRNDPTTMADMQGSCDGKIECSTCHAYIGEAWLPKVNTLYPLTDKEQDVLDKALEVKDNSRLACQVVLTPELDGLEVSMPKTARDARFDEFLTRALNSQQK